MERRLRLSINEISRISIKSPPKNLPDDIGGSDFGSAGMLQKPLDGEFMLKIPEIQLP